MRADRLLRLAEHLEEVVSKMPEGFDMNTFGTDTACGTVCCALGHATAIPEFKADGLHMLWGEADGSGERCGAVRVERSNGLGFAWDFDAAEEFFDLKPTQATYLFGTSIVWRDGLMRCESMTPNEVAARIREFVLKEGGAV